MMDLSYPRPLFKRDSYLSLNGLWDFAITKDKSFIDTFSLKINVPYSPECELSGINKPIDKTDYLHYRTMVIFPNGFVKNRVLLYIGALDQLGYIYINRTLVEISDYVYLPNTIDITCFLHFDGNDELYIISEDDADSDIYPRGKQSYKNKGIWYRAISGIFGSIFLESVPNNYLESIDIIPCIDKEEVKFIFHKVGRPTNFRFRIHSSDLDITITTDKDEYIFHSSKLHLWSDTDPYLYNVTIKYDNDLVTTHFGYRKFSTVKINNIKYFALNNKPILMKGVLDQGYFEKGIYTVTKDDDYIKDILMMKKMGFNVLRKHIKVESQRFYYHCDKLGMIVWQDFINSGAKYKPMEIMIKPFLGFNSDDSKYHRFGRDNIKSRDRFYLDSKRTIDYLRSVTSIGLWTVFNEAWGQFDAKKVYDYVLSLDNTRIIDLTSGWYDVNSGDTLSKHIYFKKIKMKNDHERVLSLSEFGGYSYYIKDHSFSKKEFGYKKMKSKEELMTSLTKLFMDEVKPMICDEGLSGFIYTQLSDVEEEVNGLMTFDREIIKVDIDKMKSIMDDLDDAFYSKFN